jgi:hypothetical protein
VFDDDVFLGQRGHAVGSGVEKRQKDALILANRLA